MECVRRLRERAKKEEAKMATFKDELVQYEGLGMPTLVSPLTGAYTYEKKET